MQWEVPGIFKLIQKAGNVDTAEMYRVFNMGIGLVLICPGKQADEMAEHCQQAGEKVTRIGRCLERENGAPALTVRF